MISSILIKNYIYLERPKRGYLKKKNYKQPLTSILDQKIINCLFYKNFKYDRLNYILLIYQRLAITFY